MTLSQILTDVGAVIESSHIVYTSWRHGRSYVNWVKVLADPKSSWATAQEMAHIVRDLEFDTVVGPTHTGDKVAYDLGLALYQLGRTVNRAFSQETDEKGKRNFPRGQERCVRGKRVLVVDDVVTTGGTISETISAVKEADGEAIAVLVGCNRSEFKGEFDGIPLLALMTVPMEQWEEGECQACIELVPINTTVGHGAEWLKKYPDPDLWPAHVNDIQA